MVMALARFNMVDPNATPESMSERYRAMLEIADLADEHGFYGITLEEHHGADNNWSPSPMLTAGMVLARTTQLTCTLSALLLPLHDPIRVAEDLAVIDLVSQGRLNVILGLGYRPEEYHLLGKDWDNRGRLFDQSIETLLAAWSGEPFVYRGETVQVTPVPFTQPRPLVMLGGSSKIACRRAARFGLPISLAANLPELEEYYYARCAEYGTEGFIMMPSATTAMLWCSEDPDRSWAQLGHHFLHEAETYRQWQTPDIRSAVHSQAQSADELREEEIYQILTPEQMLERSRNPTTGGVLTLHPLVGGMPVAEAMTCMTLFVDQVIPHLG